MPSVKSWKVGTAGEPQFHSDFQIVKKAVLQNTDIKTNRNKYYAIELHHGTGKGGGSYPYRVFTHYGRTDDLERNPDAGVRECRYHASLSSAEANYNTIYRQKTSARKGYKEVNLASSKIGSQKARGSSSGHIDDTTLQKINAPKTAARKPAVRRSALPVPVQSLVTELYQAATHTLTTTLQAKITANGIETPLGVLTLGQVEAGQKILDDVFTVFSQMQKARSKGSHLTRLADLSGDFYTAIPHRLGRSRAAMQAAILDTQAELEEKQSTLQLMRDMLQVNGDANVLFDPEVDKRYNALGCQIGAIEKRSAEHARIEKHVRSSLIKNKSIKVQNIYTLKRPAEVADFDASVGNERLLMHGSRIHNWVGILSRGILLPKTVVSLGGSRTDGGWLGHGIYFGDAACTSYYYASAGKRGTRYIALAQVALGKVKQYRKITYGLSSPPKGYDSCHGVRGSEFADDEYVVYRTRQQKLQYLVEVR